MYKQRIIERNARAKSGYILLLTLMMLSLCVVLITYLFNKGAVNTPYSYAVIKREKAKLLALSGIEIATAQLAKKIEVQQKKEAKAPQSPQDPKQGGVNVEEEAAKSFLSWLLPVLNHWQTFSLKEEVDGVDGTIKICISSEDGKININRMYDFKKHEFMGGEFGKTWIKVGFKNIGEEESYDPFEKFLKERSYRLDDVTELLLIKGFDAFKHHIFFEPAQETATKKKQPTNLADLFTVWSNQPQLEPWLLSPSVVQLLDLKRQDAADKEGRKKLALQWTKEFKLNSAWATDWNKIMKPIYGKDFASLPKGIDFLLNTKFDPKTFSVLSYGKVGDVVQKLLAIVERVATIKDSTVTATVKIKKLYWL